jgi:molybdate transport repressor ModE-like protein
MSYRRAWLLMDSLRESFQEPVTVASVGGMYGGGVLVTEFGEVLINSYRELEREITTLSDALLGLRTVERFQDVRRSQCRSSRFGLSNAVP